LLRDLLMSPDREMQIAARVELDQIGERRRKRIRADYVDPNEAGNGWSLPGEITADEARRLVNDTANDYTGQWGSVPIRTARHFRGGGSPQAGRRPRRMA
jgi:hypothetical protein